MHEYFSECLWIMEEHKGKHQYCSQQQKDELVHLVTGDSDLLSGKLTNKFSYKDAEKKWTLIASELNAIPGGQKDWKQWRKVFFFFKFQPSLM